MRSVALALFVTVIASGCASQTLPEVIGVITTDGKPVPAGTITFYPDVTKGNSSNHLPTGLIDSGGKYELYVPGGRKGAPPGWYKIVVYAVDNPQPGKPNRYFTNKRYADLRTTPLSLEVVSRPESGRYDLNLKR